MGHPNATAAAGSGGLAVLVVWLLGMADVEVSPEVAAAIAGSIITVALFIGRRGLRGLARILWRGDGSE